MPLIYADIELINPGDFYTSLRNEIDQKDIRKITVNFLVKPSATPLAINENIQEQLQLTIRDKVNVRLDNNEILQGLSTGPVEVRFKNNGTMCTAVILPRDFQPILGIIPLQGLHMVIDPVRGELIENPKPIHLVGIR